MSDLQNNWKPALALALVDHWIEDMPRWANDMSAEIKRLKNITDDDVGTPDTFRAFVRGACMFDVALDCSMIFFVAILLGEEATFFNLLDMHATLDEAIRGKHLNVSAHQMAWLNVQETFMSRDDVQAIVLLLS